MSDCISSHACSLKISLPHLLILGNACQVAHSIMVSVFHMLTHQEPYHELGAHYFVERWRHYTVDRLAQRIAGLGYRVHLEPVATTVA